MNNRIGMEAYINLLFKYNQEVNLFSRKLEPDDVQKIISESLMIDPYIKKNRIIDAGSGNGILGIPLALQNSKKDVVLVETRKKKLIYLKKIVNELKIKNVSVFEGGIKNYFNENKKKGKITLIARGFPNNYDLIDFLKNGFVNEVILITIEDKIKKIKFPLANIRKYVYNVPSKDKLKIIKLEKVSRETIKEM